MTAQSVQTGLIRAGVVDLQPSDPPDETLESLALHERFMEAFERAVSVLRVTAQKRGPFDQDTLLALHRAGATAQLAGDLRTSEELLEAALEARRKFLPPNDPRIAETLIRLGKSSRYEGDRPRARACYDEAAKILDGAGPRWEPLRASLDHAEADWLRAVDTDACIARYQRALERRRRCLRSPSYPIANNLTWLGHAAINTRTEDAHGWLAEAQHELRALGLEASTLNGVIENHLAGDKGGWVEIESHLRAAATIFENARPLRPPGHARRGCPLDGYEPWATAALHQGRFEEAWRLVERARGAIHVDFAVLGLWRDEQPDSYRTVRALRKDLLEARDRLTLERRRTGQAWGGSTWRLLLKTLELRAAIDRKEADYLRLHRPVEPSLADVRKLLDGRSALVGWLIGWLTDEDAWAYVLRQSGPVVWKRLAPLRLGSRATDRPWGMIRSASAWPFHVEFDTETAGALRAWTAQMVDPLLPELDGIEHLIVEQSSWYPIEAGIDDSGRFLGDRFDVTYVPSALHAVLTAKRKRTHATREVTSALAIAGPTAPAPENGVASLALGGDETNVLRVIRSSFPRQSTWFENIPRLPYAGLEAVSVARRFPQATLLEATAGAESRLRDLAIGGRLAGFDVVHIATHTLTDGTPERCGLAIGSLVDPRDRDDGILDLEEIALGWNLDARLLTLSGCETGVAAGISRGEGFGFTPVLLGSGARQVLTSLWPVEDRSTALLMDRFYRNLTGRDEMGRPLQGVDPMSAERALREAKTYLRGIEDRRGHHPFEHPVYWAGFILTGMPATAYAQGRVSPAPRTRRDAR